MEARKAVLIAEYTEEFMKQEKDFSENQRKKDCQVEEAHEEELELESHGHCHHSE